MTILNRLKSNLSAAPDALRRTLGYYLLFICLGLSLGINGPMLPVLAGQTQSRVGQMGVIFFAGAGGIALGTLASGHLYGRLRGHRVLGLAQIAAALMLAVVPLAPTLWLLVLIVCIKGFAEGFINTGGNSLLVWTHGEGVAPYMNGLHFSFGLGAFLAPLGVALALGAHVSYTWFFWALALLDVLVALHTLLMPSSPTPPQEDAAEAGQAVRNSPVLILVAALFLFFYVGSEITYSGWVYTYATTLGLTSAVTAAYLTSGFWLTFTVGRLLSVAAAMRLRPRRIVIPALLGCLALAVLLVAARGSEAALWTATVGLGFCMAPVWPTGFTLAGQTLSLDARTASFVLLGDSFGGMVLPWLVGQVIDATGPRAMVYVVLGSLAATLVAFLGIRKREARRGTRQA
jgi:FHS family Na+ dependent glucose MFS transporter 1